MEWNLNRILSKHSRWCIFFLFVLNALPGSAAMDYPVDFISGRWQILAQQSTYLATGNYNNDGYLAPLYQEDLFRTYHLTGGLRIDASRRLSFIGLLDFGYSESLSQSVGRRESNLNEAKIGLDYLLMRGRTEAIVRFLGTIPFLQYPLTTDDVFLGEGAYQFLSELLIQREFPWMLAYFRIGYHYRSEGLAGLLPWGVGLRRDWGPLRLSAEVWGHESVVNDLYATTPAVRTTISERVNGGSYYYNAVNPSLMAFGMQVEYFWSQAFTLSLAYNGTINGFRSGAGHEILAGMTIRTGASHGRGVAPIRRQRDNFDNYDFVPESTLKPDDSSLFDGSPDPTDQDLDETEENLERRRRR